MCGRIDEFDPVNDLVDLRPNEGPTVRHCGRDWRFLPEERGLHSFIAQDYPSGISHEALEGMGGSYGDKAYQLEQNEMPMPKPDYFFPCTGGN